MPQDMEPNLSREDLAILTIPELRNLVRHCLEIPRSHYNLKADMVNWIVAHASDGLQRTLQEACHAKLALKESKSAGKKRKRNDQQCLQRKAARVEAITTHYEHDPAKYLELPGEDVIHQCSQQFIEATSDAAVKAIVCCVCAREVSCQDEDVSQVAIANFPNPSRLTPHIPHPEHDLYQGMLLDPVGIIPALDNGTTDPLDVEANICRTCHDQLTDNETPVLSLANGLWLGRIPWELAVLTVPEQLLIAHLHPRVYVFKLYPKDPHVRPNQETLQRAMRGNVSTFEQDVTGIAAMVQGRLMPQPTEILSSLVTVTFIGKGQPRKDSFRHLFRVRRNVVHQALLCLKRINQYYADIEIDQTRLALLPDDGIPDEIVDLIRQTEDTGLVDAEASGYVPQHPEDVGEGSGISTNSTSIEGMCLS